MKENKKKQITAEDQKKQIAAQDQKPKYISFVNNYFVLVEFEREYPFGSINYITSLLKYYINKYLKKIKLKISKTAYKTTNCQ